MKIQYAPAPLLTGHDTADRAFWLAGELTGGGVRKPNGKYLSVQPDGSYQEREAVGGTYEQIALGSDLNVLVVTPRTASYRIPYVEQ